MWFQVGMSSVPWIVKSFSPGIRFDGVSGRAGPGRAVFTNGSPTFPSPDVSLDRGPVIA